MVTGARVTAVEVDRSGRVTGVTYVKDGEVYFQPAGAVILASYVYENVRLLLLSKSKAFPNGLANKLFGFSPWIEERLYPALARRFPGMRLPGAGVPDDLYETREYAEEVADVPVAH